MKWRGYFETFEEVSADNEAQAKERLRARLAEIMLLGDADFVVWELPPERGSETSIERRGK